MTVLVDTNTISQVANRGIEVIARDGSNRINATITNNSVTLNNALSADAIRVDAGSVATDTTTVCADIRGNTASTTAGRAVRHPGAPAVRRHVVHPRGLRRRADRRRRRAGVPDANNNGATTSADHGGAGFTSIADCPTAVTRRSSKGAAHG